VLVVDDEAANRRVLKQRGHHADEAVEGGSALLLLDGNDYDVIVSDLRMPGLDGEELLRRLQEDGNGLERRLIFITGDASDPRTARMLADAGVPVPRKPVGLEDLAHAIESVASERTRAGE
jgi:CheY-like chemotaxis protein